MPGDLLGEQVEGDAVVGDHRLAHGRHRLVQRRQQADGVDPDLVVVGLEAVCHQVGVGELVALAPPAAGNPTLKV